MRRISFVMLLAMTGALLVMAWRGTQWATGSPSGLAGSTTNAATAPATAPAVKPRNDLPGLHNLAQVSPGLYRGALPAAEGFAELKKLGVKTVINLEGQHSDRENMGGTGMGYVEIPCVNWQLSDVDVARFLKVAMDPANQPVFVHCMGGTHRTGTMVAAYRIIEQDWTVEQALAELPDFGFHLLGNDVANYLRHFDAKAMKAKVSATTMPDIEQIK